MNRPARILLITVLESFATILVQRGGYFYAKEVLHFTDTQCLWMALAFGGSYVLGAVLCRRIVRHVGEKALFLFTLVGQLLAHLLLAGWVGGALLVACGAGLNFLNGLKWPLIESYVGAGRTPKDAARAIGRFNICWATTLPVALLVAGPIIAQWHRGLFYLAATLNLSSLLIVHALPARPIHLPDDHPERPAAGRLTRYKAILSSSRWLMVASYALLWILAPLLPEILRGLGHTAETGTGLSGLIDLARVATFALFVCWSGWHGRLAPIAISMLATPVGFFLVLFGGSLTVVVLGEVVFGMAAGIVYFVALYHAMVIENASVAASGAHETAIGTAFVVGPTAGLIGVALIPVVGDKILGTLAGVGPLLVVCFAGALWPLRRIREPADKQQP